MADDDTVHLAAALRLNIGLLVRRMRQLHVDGDLTLPEASALGRLERGGPTTASAMAKVEQISPQSMGATLGGLEARGLVERHADAQDGRRVLLSITDSGRDVLRSRRNAGTDALAKALAAGFTRTEQKALIAAVPLIERLAQRL